MIFNKYISYNNYNYILFSVQFVYTIQPGKNKAIVFYNF